MVKLFGSSYDEIGSSDKNLLIKTSGKVKIQQGKKSIDLLDSNGNINVSIKVIQSKGSVDDIKSDGIYVINGDVYLYYNKLLFQFVLKTVSSTNSEESLDVENTELTKVIFIKGENEISLDDLPKYSDELNEFLKTQKIETLNNIVPTINWINENYVSIETYNNLLKLVEYSLDYSYKLESDINNLIDNIKKSNSFSELKAKYKDPPTN